MNRSVENENINVAKPQCPFRTVTMDEQGWKSLNKLLRTTETSGSRNEITRDWEMANQMLAGKHTDILPFVQVRVSDAHDGLYKGREARLEATYGFTFQSEVIPVFDDKGRQYTSKVELRIFKEEPPLC